MLLIPHAFAGVLIGITVNNPLLAIPLAFCSHFLLDLVPHWNPSSKQCRQKEFLPLLIGDLVGSLVLSAVFAIESHNVVVFFTGFAAILPDLLQMPTIMFGSKFFLFSKIKALQSKIHFPVQSILYGSLTQVVFLLLCVVYLLKEVSKI